MESLVFLLPAALIAGIVNGVAGGGGLIVFPALLLAGVSPVNANATNTAALWFGTVASSFAYRRELSSSSYRELFLLTTTSVTGGILGSYLLLRTSSEIFSALVPYLMLAATVIFTFNQHLLRWLLPENNQFRLPIFVIILLQLIIATYGGYFGGGAGILMLVVLNVIGVKNIHIMNAFKSWLATCINAVAIINFAIAQKILWPQAMMMAGAAVVGGYSSAYIARSLPTRWIRWFIICVGLCMTVYLFWRAD